MIQKRFVLLPVVLASAFAGGQVVGQVLGGSELNSKTPLVASPFTCFQPFTIVVPRPLAERAKVKARLLTLLRDSLYDDAKGIVNIAREKEIKKLADKLRRDRGD
jgi:hypothetical protein